MVEKQQVAQVTCTLPIVGNNDQTSITVYVDSLNTQLELDETNNIETYTLHYDYY